MWQRGPDGELRRRPAEESDPERADRPPRGRPLLALWRSIRHVYDHLGTVVAASFLWVALAASAVLGGLEVARRLVAPVGTASLVTAAAIVAVPFLLLVGPLTAGLFRFARNAAAASEPELLDLLWGFRSALRPAVGLLAMQGAVAGILGADCLFLIGQRSLVLMAGGVLFGYLLLFWGLMSLYQWPLLAEQEGGALTAVRKSALLVIDNLAYTFFLGTVAAVLTVVAWVLVLPAAILWAGTIAFLQTEALRELLRRYGILPPLPDPDDVAEEDAWGHGWHE